MNNNSQIQIRHRCSCKYDPKGIMKATCKCNGDGWIYQWESLSVIASRIGDHLPDRNRSVEDMMPLGAYMAWGDC